MRKKLKELGLFCLERRRLKGQMVTVFQYEKACWRQIQWTVLCGHGEKDEKLICSKEDFRAMQEGRERVFSLGGQNEQWTKTTVYWGSQYRLLRTNQTCHGILLWYKWWDILWPLPVLQLCDWALTSISLTLNPMRFSVKSLLQNQKEGCKSDHDQISQLELNFCS